jgi:alpha-tubulin suppressor-like RCC1 family protein
MRRPTHTLSIARLLAASTQFAISEAHAQSKVAGFGEISFRHVEANGFVKISATGWSNLAIRGDGKVAAWGDSLYGVCNLPPGLSDITVVAGGEHHALALKSDGTVYAWGKSEEGQTNVPGTLGPCQAIAAGNTHSVAFRTDGVVAC